jgi:pimeloyl-ACP methyl ester carboxylesterase
MSGYTLSEAGDVKIWRHYVNGRFGQVHVLSAAPVNPQDATQTPLVCLHHSPMSGDVYEELLPFMATDRVVHCPDTPGFGSSDRPDFKPGIEDYGRGVADAVADLGFSAENPADIFGFHTGSMVATELTLDRPELVRKMILIGFPYYEAAMRPVMEQRFVTPYAFLTDPEYVPAMYTRMVLEATNSLTNEERLDAFTDRMRAGPLGQYGPDAVWSYDADAGLSALAALNKPTMWLAYQEVLTEPARMARELFFPDAPFVELLHLPMVGFKINGNTTGPADTASAIRPFLDG